MHTQMKSSQNVVASLNEVMKKRKIRLEIWSDSDKRKQSEIITELSECAVFSEEVITHQLHFSRQRVQFVNYLSNQ